VDGEDIPVPLDVIVTDNLFGDITTYLRTMIQKGIAIAAGANINPQGTTMFEPVSGFAPKYEKKNLRNSIAAIMVCQMMLEHLGKAEAAGLVERQ
jgi:3-isopropylmalate dehydrogenase